ncbi:MAG: exosortase/archaeosortase family protein [Cytophagaceae bacterium]
MQYIITSYQKHKETILFLVISACIFIILNSLFKVYIAFTDIKGNYYSPLLAKYSLVQLILDGLIYPAKGILYIFGFETTSTSDQVSIVGYRAVHIAYPCMGVEMMIALMSLIMAYPRGKKKLISICSGILIIHSLNIIRVTVLVFTGYLQYSHSRTTHDLFNFFLYAVVFLYFIRWVKKQNKESENSKV